MPNPLHETVPRLLRDRKGATAVEYGLIAALIVIAMVAGLSVLADSTTGSWNGVAERVDNAMG